jgi:hypothetical protein
MRSRHDSGPRGGVKTIASVPHSDHALLVIDAHLGLVFVICGGVCDNV